MNRSRVHRCGWRLTAGLSLLVLAAVPQQVLAWGNEGHEIVALIARHELQPTVRKRVNAILATDTSHLVKHNMAAEATWADKWRAADGDLEANGYHRTASWHYVNLDIHRPNLRWACWGHKPLPHGVPASDGPWKSCVIDKLGQFEQELAAPGTAPHERLLALKFVLHLVGDLHQPLHASDNHDHGGNDVHVTGLSRHRTRLHHAWDTLFVRDLGRNAHTVARQLGRRITAAQRRQWQSGTPTDWAWQAWHLAKKDAYGLLPAHRRHARVHLGSAYVRQAKADVALQLSRAGVRLAWLLNRALGSHA